MVILSENEKSVLRGLCEAAGRRQLSIHEADQLTNFVSPLVTANLAFQSAKSNVSKRELVQMLTEAAHALGAHSTLRETSDETIRYWQDEVNRLATTLAAREDGWRVTREPDANFPDLIVVTSPTGDKAHIVQDDDRLMWDFLARLAAAPPAQGTGEGDA